MSCDSKCGVALEETVEKLEGQLEKFIFKSVQKV